MHILSKHDTHIAVFHYEGFNKKDVSL